MGKQYRVLVVDDEADIRMIVGLNLGLADLQFGEATNGEQAIEMLASGDWDACVLDLSMPNVDGFSVLREIEAAGMTDEVIVVVLSAHGSPTVALQALEAGAHAHLTKPFSPASVAMLVRELMDLDAITRRERRKEAIQRAASLDRLGVRSV
jgi:two-component system response regulator ResD